MSNRFTEKAERALNNAVRTAEEHGHTYIGSEHILLSLCRINESSAMSILSKHGITAEKLEGAIKEYSGTGLKSTLTPKDMTPCCKKIVENAYRISVRYSAQKIGTEHILLAILEEKDSVGMKLLSYLNADILAITDELQTLLRTAEKNHAKTKESKESQSPLRKHGKNLTNLAKEGKIDPIIGREKETDRLIRILSRKNKNNPCLIGEAGVGKTAIVEGLAQRIAAGNVPELLYGKEIICIDLSSMVSGTKYRGDFEERIKSVINEAASNKSIILFIDEIHTIVGAGAAEGAIDAANILKPQLSRGEIQLIGATTFAEYHKYIEKDDALERRFQPITVEESTEMETMEILHGLRHKYEEHHNVIITDDAISASVKYSVRYIQDRFLPDKALDVLDEACAKINTNILSENAILQETKNKSKQIAIDKEEAIKNGDLILAKNLRELEISYEKDIVELSKKEKCDGPRILGEGEIKEIINEMTGIPIVGIGEKVKRCDLISRLKSRIIGQDSAINTLADAVMRSESGISDPERPKGMFLFIGSSGVGKTELAKSMGDALFFDKRAFFKYDMSEFSEKNSVTKLIGSPPGYVGYEEGGALTEKIRRHPYSIILFDEIEKAHIEVLDLFLQIADSGTLTDSKGRSVSFKNTYIILTSNVGADAIRDNFLGFVSQDTQKRDHDKRLRVLEILRENFRIEFLNRIDEIILFKPISKDSMHKIATAKLEELKNRLLPLGITVEFSDEVAEYLAERTTEEKFGVRALLRLITSEIENPLSAFILNQRDFSNLPVIITRNNGKTDIFIAEGSVL